MFPFEIIEFTLGGFTLQEPIALVTNWLISSFCIYTLFRISWTEATSVIYFKKFYLYLGISTFFGGLGHLFFKYTGMYGKFPSWIFAILAGYQIAKGVLHYWKGKTLHSFLKWFLIIKSVSLLALSLLVVNFLFIAIDSILTYLIYTGFLSFRLWKADKEEMRFFFYGIVVLFPSAFIFLMNINIHRFLNRDDLSHILMLACIMLFFSSVKRINSNYKKV